MNRSTIIAWTCIGLGIGASLGMAVLIAYVDACENDPPEVRAKRNGRRYGWGPRWDGADEGADPRWAA